MTPLEHERNVVVAEGIVPGRAEGRVEGQRKKAIEIARSMKNDGMTASMISKYTGLDITDVESL